MPLTTAPRWEGQPVALAHLSLGTLTAAERIAAAAGQVDGIGLRFLPAAPGEVLEPLLGDLPLLRGLKARLDDAGLEVADAEIVRIGAAGLPETGPLFEACAVLGISNLLVAGDDPDRARLRDNLARLAERAGQAGVTLAVEFMPWTPVSSAQEALSLLRETGAPGTRVLVDTLHLHRAEGVLPEPGCNLYAGYVQLCDAPRAFSRDEAALIEVARRGRLVPGEGELPFAELLPGEFAPRPVSLEVPNRAALERLGPRGFVARLAESARRTCRLLDAAAAS